MNTSVNMCCTINFRLSEKRKAFYFISNRSLIKYEYFQFDYYYFSSAFDFVSRFSIHFWDLFFSLASKFVPYFAFVTRKLSSRQMKQCIHSEATWISSRSAIPLDWNYIQMNRYAFITFQLFFNESLTIHVDLGPLTTSVDRKEKKMIQKTHFKRNNSSGSFESHGSANEAKINLQQT